MNVLQKIKNFIDQILFRKIKREIDYRRRLKELRKRDPFIYK